MNKVKHVEINDGDQVLKIDVDECLDLIYDEDENAEPSQQGGAADSTDAKPPIKGEPGGKLFGEVTNKLELPKVNFVVMNEYPQCAVSFRMPTNFAKFQEKTDEELDAEIEYDMDEEDIIWLKLINEKRQAEFGSDCEPVTQEMFEMLMDRLEKESHFHSSSSNSRNQQQQQQQLTPNKSTGNESSVGEDALCCICLDGECMNTNLILFCDICNLAVHQECYGVPYIPEGAWLCRRCIQTPSAPVSCALCPNKYGAFKQTDRGLWVHVICAIWIPEVHFANVVFLEPVIGLENIDRARWRLKCYICRKSNVGACIQCDKQNCYTAFHVTCAQQAGLYLKIKETEEEEDSSPKQIKSSNRKLPSANHSGTDEDDEDRSVKKCAYCHLHTPVEVLSPEVRRKIESSMGRHHNSNEYEQALNEAQRNRMKKARKVLKERRNAPVISVPTLAQDRIDAIVARMGDMKHKKELFERLMGYWQNKRHSRYGVPLLKRLQMSGSSKRNNAAQANSTSGNRSVRGSVVNASPTSEVSSKREASASPETSKKQTREKMQGYRKFRQDMEKARLLFELVMKREKLKRELVRIEQVVTNHELNPFNGVFLQGLLATIREWDKMTIFAEPVERGVPGYYEAIKEPMDFSTVQSRIDRLYYQNFSQFERDIRLIFDNCMVFNPKTTIFYKEAHRIRDKTRELFKQAKQVYASIGFQDVVENSTSVLNQSIEEPTKSSEIDTPSVSKKSNAKSRKSIAESATPKKTALISRSVSRRLTQTPTVAETPVPATPSRVNKNKKPAKTKEEDMEEEENEESRDTFDENGKTMDVKKTTTTVAVSRRRSLRSNSVVNNDLDASRSKPNKSEEDDDDDQDTDDTDSNDS